MNEVGKSALQKDVNLLQNKLNNNVTDTRGITVRVDEIEKTILEEKTVRKFGNQNSSFS